VFYSSNMPGSALPNWWRYPLACREGHTWKPGAVTVLWVVCGCAGGTGTCGCHAGPMAARAQRGTDRDIGSAELTGRPGTAGGAENYQP